MAIFHEDHDRDGCSDDPAPAASRARFEVDERLCTGCSLCEERAPENMQIAAGAHIARVVKQPESKDEEEACAEAAEYCPTGGMSKIAPASDAAAAAAPSATPGKREAHVR
jgi:ferredoxin